MKVPKLLTQLKKIAQRISKYMDEASFLDWPYDDPWVYGSWLGDEFCYSCISPFKHTNSTEEKAN